MASLAPPGSAAAGQNSRKSLGLVRNAMKRKDSFIQLFAMTGILLLSMRSLGQKYRIHDLEEDTSALTEEQLNLTTLLNSIKQGLLHEISSRLRHLFGDEN